MAAYKGLDGSKRLGRKGTESSNRDARHAATKDRMETHSSVKHRGIAEAVALAGSRLADIGGLGSDAGKDRLAYTQDYRGELFVFRRMGVAAKCEWIGMNLTHFLDTGEIEAVSTLCRAFLSVQGALTLAVDARFAAEDASEE